MSNSYRQILTAVIAVVVLAGIGTLFEQYSQKLGPPSTATPSGSNTQSQSSPTVSDTLSYKGEDGKTVLELLERDHKVTTTDSSIGKLVTSIDGKAGDTNTYWIDYIDGAPATTAPDQDKTKAGQTVEWRLETYSASTGL